MHLTKLSIAGFKSFVDPQDLLVEPGLTGIVGPNGCGKSNLLEALRWVMGASSARAMRGGEMDDLIFSGAEGRPARETAEVALTLDNSSRQAPAEFNDADTLEVLRRLKRGAGSTYKLNGRTVRGKDIQLLFADASTGANSPSLVRQGQISELIASKPQNRRRILEEAAGIAGLNTRRHEAELKLRAAETNLERLGEVSAEIERQLESLKRQARKARKYQALSSEITALEAFIAHLKWQAACTDMDAASTALTGAQGDVETLTRGVAQAEAERARAGEGRPALVEAENRAGTQLGQARIGLARLEAEHKAAAQARQRLAEEAERLQADMAREEAGLAEARQAHAQTGAEIEALPALDEAVNAEKETAARREVDAAGQALRASEARADTAQESVSAARARHLAASNARQASETRLAAVEQQSADLARSKAALPDLDALKLGCTVADEAEQNGELALQDAERSREGAERALAEAKEAEAAAEPAHASAKAELAALDAEIAGLRRLLETGSAPHAAPVIKSIRTEPGYEKAAAAALGDDLQAPLDRGAPLYWSGQAATGGPLPTGAAPLSNWVDAPPELAARLAQCGVVSPEDGARLAAKLLPGQRLVSVDGHLWRWDGFVRTPDAPVSAAERLSQQARLEAAQAARPDLASALDAAGAIRGDLADARQIAEETLRAERARAAPAAQALNAARRTAAEARQALERAQVKHDSLADAGARLESDLAAARQALAAFGADTEPSDFSALEADLSAAREAVQAARTRETDARGRLTDLTHGRQQAEKRRAGLERDFDAWAKRADAAEARLASLAQRRTDTLGQITAAATDPEAMAASLATLAGEVDKLEQNRRAAADRLAERDAAIREAETALRSAETAASKAREQLAEWRVKRETAEARLEDCVARARDGFARQPQGLLTLAETGLDAETLASLDEGAAETRALLLRRDRDGLGGVNMDAEAEAEALAARMGAQESDKADLVAAIAKLREGVEALNAEGRGRLMEAFEAVNGHFKALFTALFRGGQAELRLIDADDPLNSGLEIMAQPPGKRLGTLNLMSGGEQALTAAALIFAVFLSRPAPICVLDEVDAPLDDANVDRFCRMLDEMRRRTDTRFIIITHNPVTMSRMDRLFGVTMREKGVSKLVSVDLGAAEELVAAE
ncbi:MAG: AAA family ATPase [Pseudomonadota bacterium]